MSYRLAVDTGGTFSDFVLLDEATGALRVFKVPSTPDDPGRAVLQGVQGSGLAASDIDFFVHGTTVGTNALLEEKGARAGLIITKGFRAVYEVQEQAREYGPILFDLLFEKPHLLVPQSRTFEVAERIGSKGEIDQELDDASVEAAIDGLEREGVQSVAICLLFSFANPEHERRIVQAIERRHPAWMVSASSELLPQIREYYRLSTTAINAYLAPKLADYLRQLDSGLKQAGVDTPRAYVMQSNGGSATLAGAAKRAVATIMSGPAGGVVAGAEVGRLAGSPNVITFDMGGTSCDVALIEGGVLRHETRSAIGRRHIAVPSLDIHTVSAGGGTLAWVDYQGALHVGPQSAGARPGPVAYGLGGETPTVTDCDLVLGYLNPRNFLGGELALDVDAARQAIEERIARPLGLDVLRAAAGVVALVDVKMGEAVKAISTQRGYDLRDFALVAFGGAGPVHAAHIALELGIPRVIAPPNPGVASALGLLMSPVRHDYVVSRLGRLLHTTPVEVRAGFAGLEESAVRDLEAEGFDPESRHLEYLLDLRYAGQGYEIGVPLTRAEIETSDFGMWRERFDRLHEQAFGHAAPHQPVEIVNYRVAGIGQVAAARLATIQPQHGPATPAAERPVVFPGHELAPCPIYDRSALGAGARIDGPAILEQYDSTVVIHPGQSGCVDHTGSVVIE
jgi:N-methylhydantoinase A